MKADTSKVMSIKEAVSRFMTNGAHISVGGFTLNRNPMAAVYEIIRQDFKDLHVYAHSNGTGVDELIGAGCVKHIEIAYAGNGKTAPTCIRFRKAIQDGTVKIEDYSNFMMTLRFQAGAMGVPFMPVLSGFGSDIVSKWGFSKEIRKENPKLPDDKLVVMDNPFGTWGDAEKVVLVPAINPDVTFIHVQKADTMGTCRMEGLTFADVEQAKASKTVVVTCEELVEPEALRDLPEQNQLPFIHVSAVCHVPFGAYPTATYRYYDYDSDYLRAYADAAKDEGQFERFQKTHVYGVSSQKELLDLVGKDRLATIKADPETGYAVNMKRG
ncbi:MAG: CoA transferase subunit A [Desulfobacterales bacterium]|nr:CoA transferase subunit A [Desulfobacterales bacterium]